MAVHRPAGLQVDHQLVVGVPRLAGPHQLRVLGEPEREIQPGGPTRDPGKPRAVARLKRKDPPTAVPHHGGARRLGGPATEGIAGREAAGAEGHAVGMGRVYRNVSRDLQSSNLL
jgi:hypothetical protein